ncbi:MAG: ATP phosphoribosyltransferase regulatory subunit [Clostridia bacterium]
MKVKYKLPIGFKDYLVNDCFIKVDVENNIINTFLHHGFLRLDTPSIEYYNLFNDGVSKVSDDKLFKITDTDGNLLVLRPDMTTPISRIVSTKLDVKTHHKFCYLGNSFCLKAGSNLDREFTQAGVEVIGKSCAVADAEVIALAIESLRATGLKDFLIDIGQVNFFKGVLKELNLSEADTLELIDLIDRKDMLGVQVFVKANCLRKNVMDSILRLPMLFGGVEILDKALTFAHNDLSVNAINNLKEIYKYLKSFGLENYISFDLSLVNNYGYYSGVVYKGLTKYFGAPILSGGRYDELCLSFDKKIPATGFAIGISNLMSALKNEGNLPKIPCVDIAVGFCDGVASFAHEYINYLIGEGFVVDNSFCNTLEDLIEYKKQKKCDKCVFIKNSCKQNVGLPKFDAILFNGKYEEIKNCDDNMDKQNESCVVNDKNISDKNISNKNCDVNDKNINNKNNCACKVEDMPND